MSGCTRPSRTKPAAIEANPPATTRFRPSRCTIASLRGDTRIIVNANGSVATPARNGEYPLTNWKYWVMRKKKPNITMKPSVMMPVPVENGRARK